jgi:Arc/MetJ-type ribon-helix-helix transcriptional regulator
LTRDLQKSIIVIQYITIKIIIMRQVLNISLPELLAKQVKQEVETGKYASISEFFRHILRSWMEDRALIELNRSKKEIELGQGKILNSLKDLR